jgi:hypothetical protein
VVIARQLIAHNNPDLRDSGNSDFRTYITMNVIMYDC